MPGAQPLHILAICSSPLVDGDGQPVPLLDVDEERRRIAAGVARAGDVARVHFLPEATTGEVQAALRDRWDVVHFTGHGTGDGRLLLEDGSGVAHLLTKEETARMFTDRRTPLVVLSACYSETVGRELRAAGVPAVVAVDARVPIADLAAIIFAEHFYGALAKGWDVPRAFEEARRAVALNPKVGDQHPPRDARGEEEEPWSQRFKLIGADSASSPSPADPRPDVAPRPRVASNMPEGSASFVGRAREIVEVVKAFDESRRICVYGPGGLGKTELSKAVARWYVERERVGAVLWASASHVESDYKLRDLASLLGAAARFFNLGVNEQSIFEEQKKAVRDFLAARSALVLLDNWETTEPQHRKELWDFVLSLPEAVRVLVTSRNVLPPQQARNIELDTLAPKDAADLFVSIAQNAGYFDRNHEFGEEELATLRLIVERLSGYPLAIEVVAGQTFSRTLTEVWEDLQRFPRNVLQSKDELTGEPRGVWTSLDLSYNVLPPEEQALFRKMSIFLKAATREDIAAITDTPNARDLLDTLVKRSLVRMREGAYSLLPIVRDYAQDKLTTANQDPRELHARAVYHYGQKGTLEDALTATDHLFELALRFGLSEAAEEFVRYFGGFYRGLVTLGYWDEVRSKTEQLVTVARAMGDQEVEAGALAELAYRHRDIGDYGRAAELVREAQTLFEAIGNRHGVATTLHQLGMLLQEQGDYEEAESLYHQSIKIGEELGDKGVVAASLHHLGMLARKRGDLDGAVHLCRQSLEIKEGTDNKKGIANTLHELGIVAYDRGDYEEAAELYRQSLKIEEELGDKGGIAASLHGLGTLAQIRGDYDEAAKLYRQSLEAKKELGDKKGIAVTLGQLGKLSQEQGQMRHALSYFLRALAFFEELRSPYRHMALEDIAAIRDAADEAQFIAWLKELSGDAELIVKLLEQQESQRFVNQLASIAQGTVAARTQGGAEERANLAQQLAQMEAEAREQGAAEVADFFAVMRGLLAGEDVAERIAALDGPLKEIAEQARAACEAGAVEEG